MILTAEQVAQHAYDAGFRGNPLAVAVAVAHAESGFNTTAVGDINLTEPDEKSVGLWQVNYRPSRDPKNPLRDPNLNLDPAHCAVAAFAISRSGSMFTPWSTFTSGAYVKFMREASLAAALVEKGVGGMASKLVAIVATPNGGYLILADDGAVYAFGGAAYAGRLVQDAQGNWQVEK